MPDKKKSLKERIDKVIMFFKEKLNQDNKNFSNTTGVINQLIKDDHKNEFANLLVSLQIERQKLLAFRNEFNEWFEKNNIEHQEASEREAKLLDKISFLLTKLQTSNEEMMEIIKNR